MAAAKYDYAKECHIALLTEEIEADAAITIALDHIDVDSGTTSIWFKAALPSPDQVALNVIVSNHDPATYIPPDPVVNAMFMRLEDDSNIPYVYASPRPMNHYSYFTSCGDSTTVGDGDKAIFDMADTDVSKTIDITFIEDVYLKDGLIQCKDAPFGAMVDIDVYHPIAGYMLSFGKKVPLYGSFPISLDTEDRAIVPTGLIIRITVFNATGTNGDDAPAAFKCIGRLELYRPKP